MPSNSDLKASLGAAARKAAGGITRAQAGAPPPGGPQGIFDLNGTPVTSVNTANATVSNGVATVAAIPARNKFELDDVFGSDLRQQYRVDMNSATLNSTTISALANRLGGVSLTQGTPANQPTYVNGDAAFGGR